MIKIGYSGVQRILWGDIVGDGDGDVQLVMESDGGLLNSIRSFVTNSLVRSPKRKWRRRLNSEEDEKSRSKDQQRFT